MFNLKFDIDADSYFKKMELLRAELIPYAMASLENFAELAVLYLQQITPRDKFSQTHLADRWAFEKSQEETVVKYTVYSLADAPGQEILWYLEEGTKAHVIPVSFDYGFLHWIDRETGDDVYTKKDVQHPGTQPYKMVEQTKDHIQGLMDAYIGMTINSIVNKFNMAGK